MGIFHLEEMKSIHKLAFNIKKKKNVEFKIGKFKSLALQERKTEISFTHTKRYPSIQI